MSCSAVFCSSSTTKNGVKDQEVSFHVFPKYPEIRQKWIRAVRRDNWQPTKYSRLCSKHFDESCFLSGYSFKKLKTDAVPTIFEGYPAYYQMVPKKRITQQWKNKIQMVCPKKLKMIQESGANSEEISTSSRRPINYITSLAKSNMLAANRLRVIKKLREKIRRLEKKNAGLLNEIIDLKSNYFMHSDAHIVVIADDDMELLDETCEVPT